jgi:hypothetical protein
MKALRILAFVLAGVASGASLQAQDIRGRVVDDATRQALVNATVLLMGADSTVVQRVGTDANGFFRVTPKQRVNTRSSSSCWVTRKTAAR